MDNLLTALFHWPTIGGKQLGFDRATTGPVAWLLWARRWRLRIIGRRAIMAAAIFFCMIYSVLASPVFTNINVALPGLAHSSVVCGDFNNHGQTDVMLTGLDGTFVGVGQVWLNHSGVFTNLNAGLPGISSSAVARGDFDNDGRLDLLITGYGGVDGNHLPIYLSQVWRNVGNGTFTNIQAGLPGVDTGAVALGDFDNDGNLDLLLTGYSSTGAVAQVWRNLGNGRFTNLNVGLPGVFYSSVALADYDNDGWLDILLTGTPDGFGNTAISRLWHNMGNGTFTNVNVGLPGVSQGAVAWGDFDQDGRPDILLTGYASTGAVCQVWHNLGNGIFTNLNAGLPGVYESSVAVGDYDNDGNLDFAVAGMDNNGIPVCQVWRNTGHGGFTNVNAGFTGIYSGSVAWADFDNDGRIDLLLAGLNSSGSPVLQIQHNNTSASASANLRITSLKAISNHAHQLSFTGQSGFGYTVWASTNLTQWAALGIPNEVRPATFQFNDLAVTNTPGRYYRLSRP